VGLQETRHDPQGILEAGAVAQAGRPVIAGDWEKGSTLSAW